MGSTVPDIDPGVQQRLTLRFGSDVKTWFDELPGLLTALAEKWRFELDSQIPRGSEAAALGAWHTVHTPTVIALDEQLGALLIEAIEPGTPLVVSSIYPAAKSVADLLGSLHGSGVPDPSYPTVEKRVAYLFDSAAK